MSRDLVWETYDRLGNGLTDGVDLRGVTTAADANADVDISYKPDCQRLSFLFMFSIPNMRVLHSFQNIFFHALRPSLSSSHTVYNHLPSNSLLTFAQRTELVEAKDEHRLVDLESEDLWLDEGQRLAVDLDEALALFAVGDCGGGLLLAEALD